MIFVDGFKASKSTGSQFWPIVGRISNVKKLDRCPFLIGIYHGNKKPSDTNKFLETFVYELEGIFETGISFKCGKTILVENCSFIADSPARAMILGVKYPNGFSSCTKCEIRGERACTDKEIRCQKSPRGRTVFLGRSLLRTDTSFRERHDCNHHNDNSILERLPIDMVSDFPLDGMHLVYLGVMRRLLEFLLRTPEFKLSPAKICSLNKIMTSIGRSTPDDFARKSRSFDEFDSFKATELRQILLYTGPVAFKSIFPEKNYRHFMTLHVAIKILSSKDLCLTYNDYAKKLLENFVDNCAILYGNAFNVFNVHNLIHLADDVRKHGPLEHFSAFLFENYLGVLKKKITQNNKVLQQIVKRLEEQSNVESRKINLPLFQLRSNHSDGPVISARHNDVQYKLCDLGRLFLSCDSKNDCVLLSDNRICRIINFIESRGKVSVIVKLFNVIVNLYEMPVISSIFHMYHVSQLSDNLYEIDISLVVGKMYLIPSHSPNYDFAAFLIRDENINI